MNPTTKPAQHCGYFGMGSNICVFRSEVTTNGSEGNDNKLTLDYSNRHWPVVSPILVKHWHWWKEVKFVSAREIGCKGWVSMSKVTVNIRDDSEGKSCKSARNSCRWGWRWHKTIISNWDIRGKCFEGWHCPCVGFNMITRTLEGIALLFACQEWLSIQRAGVLANTWQKGHVRSNTIVKGEWCDVDATKY